MFFDGLFEGCGSHRRMRRVWKLVNRSCGAALAIVGLPLRADCRDPNSEPGGARSATRATLGATRLRPAKVARGITPPDTRGKTPTLQGCRPRDSLTTCPGHPNPKPCRPCRDGLPVSSPNPNPLMVQPFDLWFIVVHICCSLDSRSNPRGTLSGLSLSPRGAAQPNFPTCGDTLHGPTRASISFLSLLPIYPIGLVFSESIA